MVRMVSFPSSSGSGPIKSSATVSKRPSGIWEWMERPDWFGGPVFVPLAISTGWDIC
jgi:hypothetical protein